MAAVTAVSTPVFVAGPYSGSGYLAGIDTLEDLQELPADYAGGISTDRIDTISAYFRR